jgi:hypothetical protein
MWLSLGAARAGAVGGGARAGARRGGGARLGAGARCGPRAAVRTATQVSASEIGGIVGISRQRVKQLIAANGARGGIERRRRSALECVAVAGSVLGGLCLAPFLAAFAWLRSWRPLLG